MNDQHVLKSIQFRIQDFPLGGRRPSMPMLHSENGIAKSKMSSSSSCLSVLITGVCLQADKIIGGSGGDFLGACLQCAATPRKDSFVFITCFCRKAPILDISPPSTRLAPQREIMDLPFKIIFILMTHKYHTIELYSGKYVPVLDIF